MPTVYYEYRFIDTIKIQIIQNITAIIYNYTQNKFYKAFLSIVSRYCVQFAAKYFIDKTKTNCSSNQAESRECRDCAVLRQLQELSCLAIYDVRRDHNNRHNNSHWSHYKLGGRGSNCCKLIKLIV